MRIIARALFGLLTASVAMVSPTVVYAGNTANISDFTPICIGSATTFAAETSSPSAQSQNPDHEYGDLITTPNPGWFYLKVEDAGVLNIVESNSNNLDVDGAFWGPFDDLPDFLRSGVLGTADDVYGNSLLLDSDYDPSSDFNFTHNVIAGKYYVLLITNFSSAATDITFDTGPGSTATSNCDMLSPGINISVDSTQVSVVENGATETFTASLYSQPTSSVTISTTVAIGEVAALPGSMTFTPSNWYLPQAIQITAVDDALDDGDIVDTVTLTAGGADTDYNTITKSVTAIAIDNDITTPSSVTITEDANDDGVINGSELRGTVEVSVALPSGLSVGDTVTVTDGNGSTQTVSLTLGNIAGPVAVSFPAPTDGGSILATASISDSLGHSSGTAIDSANIDLSVVLTIAVDAVTADNIVNAAEAATNIPVTGTVAGEFNTGDTVTLLVNSNTYTGVVDVAGAFSIIVPGADLAADTTLDASVATTDTAGNTGSAFVSPTHTVDTIDPVLAIALDTVTADNAINAAEAIANIPITGTVAGEFSTGDTVTLVANRNTYTGVVDAAGAFSISVPGADLAANNTIDASVATTDAAGNTASVLVTPTYTVDTTDPIPTIAVDSITADNTINAAESGTNIPVTGTVAGEFNTGDTVTLVVNSNTYTGVVNVAGGYSISVSGADLAADSTIDADMTTTDAAGNAASVLVTVTHTVDTANPVPVIVLDSITVDNTINAVESGANVPVTGTVTGDFIAGDTITLVVNSNTYTGVVDGAGRFGISVAGADLAVHTTIDISVVTTDGAGNPGAVSVSPVYSVDLIVDTPIVSIVEDVDDDGVVKIAEISGETDIIVTLPAGALAGDSITLTDGTTAIPVVLSVADINAGIVTFVVAPPDDGDALTVTATLTDAAGNVSAESIDTASFDLTAPILTTDNVGPISDTTPTLQGATDQVDGSEVTIADESGSVICTATVAAGAWSCNALVSLPYGSLNLTAEITDASGNPTVTLFTVELEMDFDNDGFVNSLDLDDDNDGIPDLIEQADGLDTDTDNDGIVDSQDLDSDNDGVLDIIEAGGEDNNNDGLIDDATDSDGDGLADSADANPTFADIATDAVSAATISVLAIIDTDGDGTPDFQDVDSDNDGITDANEISGDPINPPDTDNDGVPDYLASDSDADGIPDSMEVGSDPETPADSDDDGIYDYQDIDSDNDGIPDVLEGDNDTDGDGVADFVDNDSDNDGVDDAIEGDGDKDGDGLPNFIDLDSDNDGVPDAVEGDGDSDADGVPDYRDLDSDNDGVADLIEAGGDDKDGNGQVDDLLDSNLDGIDDAVALAPLPRSDTDNDGIVDYLDLDSDNDGLADIVETQGIEADTDGDGEVDEPVDDNGDGIDDAVLLAPALIEDIDGDGLPNHLDIDTDGDGISDLVEGGGTDIDGDGIEDSLADSDADGIPDSVDVDATGGADVDGDGIDDIADASILGEPDQDFDGIIDALDPDADGNGLADDDSPIVGAALPDLDNNGVADVLEISGKVNTGLSGRGCSIYSIESRADPSMLILMLLATSVAGLRRWRVLAENRTSHATT